MNLLRAIFPASHKSNRKHCEREKDLPRRNSMPPRTQVRCYPAHIINRERGFDGLQNPTSALPGPKTPAIKVNKAPALINPYSPAGKPRAGLGQGCGTHATQHNVSSTPCGCPLIRRLINLAICSVNRKIRQLRKQIINKLPDNFCL